LRKGTEEVVKKIDILTKKTSELGRVFSELKVDVEELKKSSGRSSAILFEETVPSDWTKMSVQALQGADFATLARTFETYKPTILALRPTNGLTAGEVAKCTKRSRQLEVTYLNRLSNAGVLSKKRIKKKVIYEIINTSKILSLLSK
jgi:hypothetical protein